MPDLDTQERDTSNDPTLQQTVTLLKSSLVDYANTRKELAAIEIHEAKENLITKVSAIVIMAVCSLFSYILFLAFLIGFGSSLLQKHTQSSMGRLWELCDPWMFLTLILSVIHIIVVLTFFDRLSRASKTKLFTNTLAELENDRKWLEENKSTKGS